MLLPSSSLTVREFDGEQFCEFALHEIPYDEGSAFYLQMSREMGRLNATAVNVDVKEFCIFVHEVLLRITGASLAFVGEVLTDAETGPFMRAWAISSASVDWNLRVQRLMYKQPFIDFKNTKTLFGTAIAEKHVVVSLDPAKDPRAGGLPSGHVPLQNFVGIPLVHEDTLIGMLGVANFDDTFTRGRLRQLCPLVDCIAGYFAMHLRERDRQHNAASVRKRKRDSIPMLRGIMQSAMSLMESAHVVGDDRETVRELSENASALYRLFAEGLSEAPAD